MKTILTRLFLFLLIATPTFAIAQEALPIPLVPKLFGTFSPKVGAWSEYIIFEKNTGQNSIMRMSILSEENGSYWYEVLNEEGGTRIIVKMLVTGDPNNPQNIKRLILKSGDHPPQEMPHDFVMMGRRMATYMFEKRSGVPSSPPSQLMLDPTGKGTVTVPAGNFDVTYHRIIDEQGNIYGNYKFSPLIHPFGVVSSDTENTIMVLKNYGNEAQSMIDRKPTQLDRPPGMPDMPRGIPLGLKPPWAGQQQQPPQEK